jgi:hypothetical protein
VTLFERLPLIGPWCRRQALIDSEAISLLQSAADPEDAYQTARKLMRLAREQGDQVTESLFAKIAVRIACVTGRVIGKGISPRYAMPTYMIDGDRIVSRHR